VSAVSAYAPPTSVAVAPPVRGAGSLLARAALLLAFAAMPVAFSAWIDPARFVTPRAEETAIARVLASGRNVTDFANYDDRAIARALVALKPERPEVLGLGSSRLQPLRESALPGRRFVNGAVQGATLDDLLGMYALYDTDSLRPKRVLLNVDPWTQSSDGGIGWRALSSERTALMQRIGLPVSPWRDQVDLSKKVFKLVAAPEYFRLAVFSFRHYGPNGIPWVATDREQNREKTKLPNGSVVWSDLPPDNALPIASQFAAEGLFVSQAFEHLDARAAGREDALERFIRYMRKEHVEVTVLLVPFPPEVYDAFARLPGTKPMAIEAELRAIAQRTGANVLGSYDPRPFGIVTRDFFDEDHLRPEPLSRLVSGMH
jgi:hypothetical protein